MNLTLRSSELDLTACIDRNRVSIVAMAMSRSLPQHRHTVLADALANRTLDYLLETIADDDEGSLIAWVTSNLCGSVLEQSLFNIFTASISSALDMAARDFGPTLSATYGWLEDVQRRIDLAVGASRREYNGEHFSLDSVDAKIDEVLYRLSERDTLTAEHSRSVGLWCWRIAKKMGFTRSETLLTTRSGTIHDIGKISTPIEILTAPRALDETEWRIMRMHTLQGVQALETIPELSSFVPAVRWHHERMDGRGYPDALSGSEIPVAARVVAVADAFNAMVARRPYREPLSPSAAVEELKRHSGTHFDPSIVSAMIDAAVLK
jgi:HD-GYP domain-containing protein (c-di-GMP phosphodiesterase class II)